MRMTEILQPECIKVPLLSQTKQEAIYELADLLAEQTGIHNVDALKKAIWDRETTRTTGIGHGVGIPHGKSEGCDRLYMALGVPQSPIEFGAIDGRPVSLIFLLVSPLDQTGPHIQALATISRMLTDEKLRHAMQKADSADSLYAMIMDYESQ